jgi:hypothetical protein
LHHLGAAVRSTAVSPVVAPLPILRRR